jgi:molybdate transport system ATP-binding protein
VATLDLRLRARLRAFDLDVALTLGAETLALAGPSGAGKTTVLRMLCGLARPDDGRIAVAGRTWLDTAAGVDLRPERRAVGLVPQDHALFPHMTALGNVAFADRARAGELLERLGVAHLAGERPGRLSGGERQRVALARALARRPQVLALDEPLAALDAQTRRAVRRELGALLRDLAIPTLLVTHDFDDAAELSDRVAVLADGRLRQVGTPAELLAEPADAFVASFAGANALPGTAVARPNGGCAIALDAGGELLSAVTAHGRVAAVVAPWDVALARGGPGVGVVVASAVRLGSRTRVHAGPLVAEVDGPGFAPGERVVASAPPERVRPVAL